MLKILDVSQTEISSLPDSIGALTNLERLNLSQTKISMLPHSIDALKMLKILDVSLITCIYNLNSYPNKFIFMLMHVIVLFRNFLHSYVISLKSIFMHKLGIFLCLIDD